MPGQLDRVPNLVDILFLQRHRHGNGALPDGGGHGLDPQSVRSGIVNALQLDDADAKAVQQLGQLDLFPEGQSKAPAGLSHGNITDSDLSHSA